MNPLGMKHYDVIIAGAGPAGLRCAEILAPSGLKVLLLEKKQSIGQKVCAGGITRKLFSIYDFPETLIETSIHKILLSASHRQHLIQSRSNFLFTIDRKVLGLWQLSRIKNSAIDIQTAARLSHIEKNYVVVNREDRYTYTYLVGADGSSSLVRRHLHIPAKKYIMALQYKIPYGKAGIASEIHLDSNYFHAGYGWIFPHKDYLAVGCGADPRFISPKKLKAHFHQWLNEKHFDITHSSYESFPILYDYRGFQFGNIFLAGDAAGLASGLTGEGILPALVSGEEVAKRILDKNHKPKAMEVLIRHKRKQENILRFLNWTGPLRNTVFNIILLCLKNEGFNRRLTKGFS